MIGKTLSKRYKIVEKIGCGGMAVVYKGMDTLLHRTVTIKVLQEQYASDTNFIKRFRREAQAVASLSHPNIVSIYDVGQEKNIHYLVMEYVEGKNLKELIKEEAPLDFEKSIKIAMQICDALEHAHANGVIHRDIKPHNIIISNNGQVKVTDFGIARAVTEATITYTGSMVGSVHYISPEQARGEMTDYKSDIYSVGVVLFEMVTGKVPFSGEGPIATALKHVQEEPPSVREINPEVPVELQDIIDIALNKEPADRYESVTEMKNDLVSSLYEVRNSMRRRESKIPHKRKKLKPLGWVLLTLMIVGGLYLGYAAVMEYLIVEEVKMPDLTGKSLQEAQMILQDKGLEFTIAEKRNSQIVEKNHVLEQKPAPGEIVKKSRTVELIISLGPELMEVPDVKGKLLRHARIEIMNANFLISPNIENVYDDEIPEGRVIDQDPQPGEKMPEGTQIHLVVSKGPKPKYIEMPSLIGLTLAEAETKLSELRLQLGVVSYQTSEEYFTGHVLEQDVLPGTEILQESTVNLVVSKGPGPKPQSARIAMTVSEDGQRHVVRIVVEDMKGRHQEYMQEHKPGDSFVATVPFYGKGVIKIYQDDKLVKEQAVPLGRD